MIINTYQKYIAKKFIYNVIKISLVFYSLIFIMNILEEINFLKGNDASFMLPIILTFLNAPSVLYEIFPFIFLIGTLFFFIEVIDKEEINILKLYGITNLKIIQMLKLN